MIYTIGFLVILAARVVYAGMKQHELFYTKITTDYEALHYGVKKGELAMNGEKVFKFVVISLPLILLWPISLPALGLFKLGQRYAKNS